MAKMQFFRDFLVPMLIVWLGVEDYHVYGLHWWPNAQELLFESIFLLAFITWRKWIAETYKIE